MKPGTPCWSSAAVRQSAQHQTITLLITFPEVTPAKKQLMALLNPRAFKLDVRKFALNRVPDNLAP